MKIRDIILLFGLLAFFAGGGIFAVYSHMQDATAPVPESILAVTPAAGDAAPVQAEGFDLKSAMADRTMGEPDAPIRLDEYASLTCSHCAAFSKETYDKIEEKYIKTGKVLYAFHDFPLNAPALDAATITRCLPPERYFAFIKFLFESQEKWAFNEKPRDILRQDAKLVGMSDEQFDACINNTPLREAIADAMKDAASKYKIEATPTFIITDDSNGGTQQTLRGDLPLDGFTKVLDPLVNKDGKN